MALEDFMEPEVGVAVALTAAVASPQVRSVLRRGAVYGLAGLLLAGDALSSLAQGVKRGAQTAAAPEASETPVPEILSADGLTPEPAPAAPKRVRKTAEAADNG